MCYVRKPRIWRTIVYREYLCESNAVKRPNSKEKELATKIEIDGGVTIHNAKKLIDAGADVLVAGSFVFKSENPTETIRELKEV